MKILKSETIDTGGEELHLVYGEVYIPDTVDSQDDFMDEDNIRKMAHSFMKRMRQKNVDQGHTRNVLQATIVESFIVRKDDPVFPHPGAWGIVVEVEDPRVWEAVKNGELNGFSLDGKGYREPVELILSVPEEIHGVTEYVEDHEHEFTVEYDVEGRLVKGETNVFNGHSHRIVSGSVTEEAAGHRHRFSHLD